MKRLVSVLLAAAMLGLLAAPVSAATERIPIAGSETLVELLDPGRTWTSDGIEHVRGWTAVYAVVGDELSTGTSMIIANWNLDSSGDGTMWGTNRVRLDAYDGGWTQAWTAKWSGGTWTGQGVDHGYGEMTGWQSRLDVWVTGFGTDSFSGYAFAPGS